MYWVAALLFFIGVLAYGYSISNQLKLAPAAECGSCPKKYGNSL
jgi:hypothetical protein